MSRKTTELTPLQARKQLLLLESELNRLELAAEWQEVKAGVAEIADQFTTIGSVAESAAKIGMSCAGLFSGIADLRNGKTDKKPSWISSILSGTRAGLSIWSAVRSHWR